MDLKLSYGHFYGESLRSRKVAGLLLTETLYRPYLKLPKHSHEHAYISVVVRGGYSETAGLRTRDCKPHTFIFHPPDESHSDSFYEAGGLLFSIEIGPSWIERMREHSVVIANPVDFQGGLAAQLSLRLYSEFSIIDRASPLAIEGLLLEILAEVFRAAPGNRERQAPRWLKSARELVEARFSEKLSLLDIAQTVGVHPVHLAREFRKHYRCTMGEYIRRLRIEFACREVSNSDATLAEIASAAGFSDQGHFSRTFKRITGKTPADYRSSARSG